MSANQTSKIFTTTYTDKLTHYYSTLCINSIKGVLFSTFLTLLGTLLGVIGAFLLVGDAGTLPYVISIAVISAFALCYKQKQYTKHY